jgi:hypothetical protein
MDSNTTEVRMPLKSGSPTTSLNAHSAGLFPRKSDHFLPIQLKRSRLNRQLDLLIRQLSFSKITLPIISIKLLRSLKPNEWIRYCNHYQSVLEQIFVNSDFFNKNDSYTLTKVHLNEMIDLLFLLSDLTLSLSMLADNQWGISFCRDGYQRQNDLVTHFLLHYQFSLFYSLFVEVFEKVGLEKFRSLCESQFFHSFMKEIKNILWINTFNNYSNHRNKFFGCEDLDSNFSIAFLSENHRRFRQCASYIFFVSSFDDCTHRVKEELMGIFASLKNDSLFPTRYTIQLPMPIIGFKYAVIDAWLNFKSSMVRCGFIHRLLNSDDYNMDTIRKEFERCIYLIQRSLKLSHYKFSLALKPDISCLIASMRHMVECLETVLKDLPKSNAYQKKVDRQFQKDGFYWKNSSKGMSAVRLLEKLFCQPQVLLPTIPEENDLPLLECRR